MDNSAFENSKLSVIFRYQNAKGLFLEVADFKPGGAPIMMYSLATELAKDSSFDVYFWVDGEVPEQRINGVKLISMPDLIQHGLPGISRILNEKRLSAFWEQFKNSVCVFTVADGQFFPSAQERIHEAGGKTIYAIASDIDVIPEKRFADGKDPFSEAIMGSDLVLAQTEYQQRIFRERFGKEARVIQPAFFDAIFDNPKKDIILWVGQCIAIKRPWIVAEMARRFENENFVMIMPEVDTNLSFAIKDDLEKISNLKIISHVNPDEIQRFFNRSKIVLNTSVYEGYPNTLHQSSIGRAPYLSLSWDPDEYLENNGIGVGADNDVEGLVHNLSTYLADEKLRKSIGENAYKNFKEEHDIAKSIEDFKKEIRSLAMIKS